MSTVTEVNPRLLALTEAGVSVVWLDQIRRSLVTGGELARMVRAECLRGVTANPSIFERAILGSTDYDEDLEGATGDLARRKLPPSLYNLAHQGALPERFELIGVARSEQRVR